jgi:2-dehydro-3-deoxy-D-gluconate 5-dehydrogenase
MGKMILDKFKLQEKVAIVTGASRGLGQGIAIALAEAGADVALVARTIPALEQTAAAIHEAGRKALVIPVDVSGAAEAEHIVQETVKGLGHVDILLNVAGTQVRKPFFEMNEQDYEYLMGVNLKALYFISQAAAKEMAKQSKGKIISITSLTSFIGISNISLYTASKGAVAALTRQFAVELSKYNIQCNAIGPGYFRTELTEALFQDQQKAEWVLNRIPMGRVGIPEDLAGAAVFLSSEASNYITGQIINVDGGWLSA